MPPSLFSVCHIALQQKEILQGLNWRLVKSRIVGFEDMLEDHVEKSHEDGDKHDQRVARVARCKLLSLREDSKQSWRPCCSERSNGKEKAPASGNPLEQVWRQKKNSSD
jgi:hypothetical protein